MSMKIMAVDYGDARTGLAVCDRTEFLTSPITPQITVKPQAGGHAARHYPHSRGIVGRAPDDHCGGKHSF